LTTLTEKSQAQTGAGATHSRGVERGLNFSTCCRQKDRRRDKPEPDGEWGLLAKGDAVSLSPGSLPRFPDSPIPILATFTLAAINSGNIIFTYNFI